MLDSDALVDPLGIIWNTETSGEPFAQFPTNESSFECTTVLAASGNAGVGISWKCHGNAMQMGSPK